MASQHRKQNIDFTPRENGDLITLGLLSKLPWRWKEEYGFAEPMSGVGIFFPMLRSTTRRNYLAGKYFGLFLRNSKKAKRKRS